MIGGDNWSPMWKFIFSNSITDIHDEHYIRSMHAISCVKVTSLFGLHVSSDIINKACDQLINLVNLLILFFNHSMDHTY